VSAGPTPQFGPPGGALKLSQQFPGIGVALTQVPVAPSQSVPGAPGVPLSDTMQVGALSVYPHPVDTAQQTNGMVVVVVVVAPAIVVVVVVVGTMQDSMSELSGAQRALPVNMSPAPVQTDWVTSGPTAQFALPATVLIPVQQFPGIGVALTQVPVAPSQSVPAAPGVPFMGDAMQVAAVSVYAHTPPAILAQQTKTPPPQ
jgi:hypothetical protein